MKVPRFWKPRRLALAIIAGIWIASCFIGGANVFSGRNIRIEQKSNGSYWNLGMYSGAISVMYQKYNPWSWTRMPGDDVEHEMGIISWGPKPTHCARGLRATTQQLIDDAAIQKRGELYPIRLILPFSLMVIPLLVLEAWEQILIATRQRKGLCGKCGYDLCATQNQCPECGTIPA